METTSLSPITLQQTGIENAAKPIIRRRIAKKHIVFGIVISLILLLISSFLLLHAYIAWVLMNPNVAALTSNPMLAKGLHYEDVTFASKSGRTNVDGWYIPADSASTVIFSHGYGANREEVWVPMYDLADTMHKQNYNVLMFDYGFASTNNKQTVTGGKEEAQQLLGAIDFVKQRGAGKVYIWGFSMGAGTALQAALQTNDIDGMILDSTFLLEPDTLYHNIKQEIDLPRFPSLALVRSFFPILNGTNLDQIPYQEVKSTHYRMPIFMIHGMDDARAPYEIAEEIAKEQSGNPESQFWLVPGGLHELIFQVHRKEYLQRTLGFLHELQLPQHGAVALAS